MGCDGHAKVQIVTRAARSAPATKSPSAPVLPSSAISLPARASTGRGDEGQKEGNIA